MGQKDIDKEVFDILNTAKPIKSDNRRTFRTALIALAILIVTGSALAMYSVLTAPRGEIVSPAPGSLTSRVVALHSARIPRSLTSTSSLRSELRVEDSRVAAGNASESRK